jgi:HEAT repeat protein
MKSVLTVILLFAAGVASAQTPGNDFLDSLGLARLKNFSAARVSSDNRYVFSNDDSKHIMPGQTLVMADLAGPGVVTHIWLTVADNEFGWPRLLRLRAYYDGKKTPSVDSPLGDFFGVGHGMERDLNSIMVEDTSLGRARNSYWPMPFQKSCKITVTNEGNRPVRSYYYHVDWQRWPALPNDLGYFHAYYRQERPATPGRNYEFLSIRGTGHYMGTVLSVIQTAVGWFGEGDDLFYADGAKHPQIYGTGTEDYFNEGWGLRDFCGPWSGSPIAGGELTGARLGAYRWHVPDPIPFTKSLWAGLEHYGWTYNPDGTVRSGFEERPDYYSSVAFWYQKGVNEDLPEPPYGDERLPLGSAAQLAVEDSIQEVTSENGKASVQREVDWAKDLLFFQAQGKGARINVPIDIADAGRYELVALLAQGPDYGDYVALLDDEPTNLDKRKPATSEVPAPGPEVFHNFLPEVYVAQDRPLGWFSLTKGRHTLSFVCVGKDNRSAGYNLGINDVVLEKIPAPAGETETKPQLAPELPPVAAAVRAGVPVFRGLPLSAYREKLKHASDAARPAAVRALGAFGEDAGPAVGDVTAALGDPDVQVRSAAAWALSQIGRKGDAAVPALAKALSDSNPHVRDLAALALKAMGPAAAPAVPELIAALSDPVAYVRAPVADALGAIGPAARLAVHPLAERLLAKDEQGLVLNSIATALGDIGPEAKDALPALQQALAMHRIGSAAQEALLKIEGKPVPMWW